MNLHIQALKSKLEANANQQQSPQFIISESKTVDAVDEQHIEQFTTILSCMNNTMYADIWKLGVNLALRITDLLSLKLEDCVGKDELYILEGKTSNTRKSRKYRKIVLNNTAKKIIARRARLYPEDTYLFESKHTNATTGKPISRQSVWSAFSKAGKSLNIHTGTHSLRKTLGAKLYRSGVPVATIQKMFSHSTEAITLAYIGVTQLDVDSCYTDYEVEL